MRLSDLVERGRVVGVMGSLAYAAGPLGLIVAGPLADQAALHGVLNKIRDLGLPIISVQST